MKSPETCAEQDNQNLIGDRAELSVNAAVFTENDADTTGREECILWSKKRMAIAFVKGLFILVLVYAAIGDNESKISKSPSPFPFFRRNSVVTDYYRGELSRAVETSQQTDVAFIMFYAPWSAECQHVRHEFEKAAEFFRNRVKFAAVNCWNPNGECRKQYSKAYSWPILIAYAAYSKGIQYRGLNNAYYISKFLKGIEKPLVRINNGEEVFRLLLQHDAVVSACLDATPGSYEFAVYYTTALRFLEKDPMQEVIFSIMTGPCEQDSPLLSLTMWNETLIYHGEWVPNSILNWIWEHVHQISIWLTPSGSKSITLSNYLQPGPSLILFTPRNPLHGFNDYYNLLRSTALEYYSYNENLSIPPSLHQQRLRDLYNYKNLLRDCYKTDKKSRRDNVIKTRNFFNNSTCPAQPFDEECIHDFYHIDSKSNFDCVCENDFGEDSKQAKNLQELSRSSKCNDLKFAESLHPAQFSDLIENDSATNIIGLFQKNNFSLNFIALDSLNFHHFAKRLGVDVLKSKDKSALVIIDDMMETYHVLNENINDETIRSFIRNYTENNISTIFHSGLVDHSYENNDCIEKNHVCLMELNTTTFLPTIMQENKAVIVLYYSKQCAFCTVASYSFLKVAKLFSGLNITFARIDGDGNNLPWQFSMDSYPTIIFFPAKRKSESNIFPKNVPFTVETLSNFILSNSSPGRRLYGMWSLCMNIQIKKEKSKCTSQIREEILRMIGATLRNWRLANRRMKKWFLHRLKQLRALSFLLMVATSEDSEVRRHFHQFLQFSNELDNVALIVNGK